MKRSKLFPDAYVPSVYDVDFSGLSDEGYRGVIFDIDNTLVPHNAPADDRAKAFFSYLNENGFSTLLLSNNKEPRVKDFQKAVEASAYIYRANKPNPANYERAMERMGTSRDTTLFVGDQIFTDIWGANRAGIRSIMVKPVKKWREEPQIILKRLLEAIVLLGYRWYLYRGGKEEPLPMKEETK